MTKTLFTLGASAVALLGAAGAIAAPADAPRHGRQPVDMTRAQLIQKLDARFAKMDANHDGVLTREDMQANRKARHDARFAKLDADGNGAISRAEYDAPRGEPGKDHGRRGHHGPRHGGMMGVDKGPVTKAQFQERALARFDRLDTDRNGTVTVAERKAGWAAMKARRDQARQG
jgi:Ca2+-binding EF-hand superfamily protein